MGRTIWQEVADARQRIGMEIMSTNQSTNRPNQWGEILNLIEHEGSLRWTVLWPDGHTELWPADVREGTAYRFRGEPLTFTQEHEPEPEIVEIDIHLPATWPRGELEHSPVFEHTYDPLRLQDRHTVDCRCGWRAVSEHAPEVINAYRHHEKSMAAPAPAAPAPPPPAHQWHLEHELSRWGLEQPNKMRAVCTCGWKPNRWYGDIDAATEAWAQHAKQMEEIPF